VASFNFKFGESLEIFEPSRNCSVWVLRILELCEGFLLRVGDYPSLFSNSLNKLFELFLDTFGDITTFGKVLIEALLPGVGLDHGVGGSYFCCAIIKDLSAC